MPLDNRQHKRSTPKAAYPAVLSLARLTDTAGYIGKALYDSGLSRRPRSTLCLKQPFGATTLMSETSPTA